MLMFQGYNLNFKYCLYRKNRGFNVYYNSTFEPVKTMSLICGYRHYIQLLRSSSPTHRYRVHSKDGIGKYLLSKFYVKALTR